jgi:hypothetical protein
LREADGTIPGVMVLSDDNRSSKCPVAVEVSEKKVGSNQQYARKLPMPMPRAIFFS